MFYKRLLFVVGLALFAAYGATGAELTPPGGERDTQKPPPGAPGPSKPKGVEKRAAPVKPLGKKKWGPAFQEFGGELELRWLSDYFFRGFRFSRNDVLQSDVALWYKGFKVAGTFNYKCHSDDFDETQFNEADGTLSYSYLIREDTVLEAGYTYFGYPHKMMGYDIDDTQEVFAGLTGKTELVSASLYGFYDFDEGTGSLWEFGMRKGWKIPLGKELRIGSLRPFVGAKADLNVRYFNSDTEFSHSILSAGVPVYLGEQFSIEPSANYQWGWQGWVEDKWYFQAGVKYRF